MSEKEHGWAAELGDIVGELGLGDEPPAPKKRARKRKSVAARTTAEGAPQVEPPASTAAETGFLKRELSGLLKRELSDGAAAEPAQQRSEDAAPTAAGVRAERTFSASDATELADLAAALTFDVVPLWETTDSPTAPPDTPDLTLWDAFAPELDAEPPRAWSPAAAMEVLEPAGPPAPPEAEPETPTHGRLRATIRSRLFTAATVAAILVAIAVVVLTRVDFGHTSGPAQPVSKAAFEVTMMRTVDATSPASVGVAQTRSSFPAKSTQIFMDVVYRNATSSDTLRLVIDLLPPPGSGGNPAQVGDQTHPLPGGGEIAVTIQGPADGFSPGDYRVTAFHDGHLEQSLNFTVAAPLPTPTPTAATTAAPATPTAPVPARTP